MDPISSVVTIWTLIEGTAIILKQGRRIYESLHDAPSELQSIITLLSLIQAELTQLRDLSPRSFEAYVPSSTTTSVCKALQAARTTITDVEKACIQIPTAASTSLRTRLRWACKDRRSIESLLAKLQATESSLTTLLQLLAIQLQMAVLSDLQHIKSHLANGSILPIEDRRRQQKNSIPGAVVPFKRSQLFSTTLSLETVGLRGSMIVKKTDAWTEHRIYVRMDIPLPWFGRQALMAAVSFKTFPFYRALSWNNGGGLCMSTILPPESPIMRACDKGDMYTVKNLLQTGQARLDCVTPSNWTPLAYAIKSANVDLVNFLLDNGAGIEWTLGLLQTNPLQWAIWHGHYEIAEALVRRGADESHSNIWGWTPIYFCWPEMQQGQPVMLKYIKLLSRDPSFDLGVCDQDGWHPLDRAAAFGTPVEVAELLRLGANTSTGSPHLSWQALHFAIFYGNCETSLYLLPFFQNSVLELRDDRGWTLLHVAVEGGHDQMIGALIDLGADLTALSEEFSFEVPESLVGRRCTPGDVAVAKGSGKLDAYRKALRDRGLEDSGMPVADIDLDETFFDAEDDIVD